MTVAPVAFARYTAGHRTLAYGARHRYEPLALGAPVLEAGEGLTKGAAFMG